MRFLNLRIISNREYNDLVSKAELYEDATAKMESLKNEESNKISAHVSRNKALERSLEQCNEESLKLGNDLAENAKKIEDLTAQNKKCISSVKDYSAKNKKLDEEVNRLNRFISELKSANAKLGSENKKLKRDLEESELTIKSLNKAIEGLDKSGGEDNAVTSTEEPSPQTKPEGMDNLEDVGEDDSQEGVATDDTAAVEEDGAPEGDTEDVTMAADEEGPDAAGGDQRQEAGPSSPMESPKKRWKKKRHSN